MLKTLNLMVNQLVENIAVCDKCRLTINDNAPDRRHIYHLMMPLETFGNCESLHHKEE
jgi:hypothetical protein